MRKAAGRFCGYKNNFAKQPSSSQFLELRQRQRQRQRGVSVTTRYVTIATVQFSAGFA
jgi:hypothetical protein